MQARRRLGLAMVALAAGCGPTPFEASAAVIIALPVAILAGHLLVRLLVWLWRPLRALPLSARPALVTAAIAAAAAAATALLGGDAVQQWIVAALALFGPSYLAVLLVAWRIWLSLDEITASSWSFIAAISITVLPGMPLLLGRAGDYAETVIAGWIVVGYMGLVTGPILVLLVAEALIRRWMAAR